MRERFFPVSVRMRRWGTSAPWFARVAVFAAFFVAVFVLPPLVSALGSPSRAPQGWLLTALAQAAAMIVFALSYNLLLGETGLLSFGHAAPAGLGALFAAQMFNRHAIALPLLPLVGGAGGAAFGVVTALVAARRAGTAFAMITLGLGELVAAAAWALPGWFGGEGGVAIDRGSGPVLGHWTFGPDGEAYCVIAAWCAIASVAMFALSRMPLVRLANAVRDNRLRAAALGIGPARTRGAMIVWSAAFAGVAGTLALINVEMVAAESVGMSRSAAVLIATVTGGSASLFGPVLGALVWVAFSVGVASVSRAWMLYVGVFFVAVVLAAPDGLAGLAARQHAWIARHGWRAAWRVGAAGTLALLCAAVAFVLAAQWAYAIRLRDSSPDAWLAALTPLQAFELCGALVALAVTACVCAQNARRLKRSFDGKDAERGGGAAPGEREEPIRSDAVSQSNVSRHTTSQQGQPDRPGHWKPSLDEPSIALELRGIAKRFGATKVLRGVDLTVQAGERHALIGPNGAGKSTLFSLIAGERRPSAGRIELLGADTTRLSSSALARRGLARSFQTPSVFPRLSVFDNVRCAVLASHGGWTGCAARWFGSREADARALDVIESVGLSARATQPAGGLSYAAQRALDLALALASGAHTLLLDEPTAGLNRAESAQTIALIRSVTAGKTLVIVEHDMEAVFGLADRISVLVQGRVIATGTPEAIRADRAVREAYLGTAR